MATQSVKMKESEKIAESADGMAVAGMETLVQNLIKEALSNQASSAACRESNEEDDVILDLEIDGVRCLLIRAHPKPAAAAAALSPREQEIARMIAKGYPNKTIAAVLDISTWTVCTHIRRVFAKLGVGSRAAMVAKLLEDGSLTGVGASLAPSSCKNMG